MTVQESHPVLPDGFWEWSFEQQDSWLEKFLREAWRKQVVNGKPLTNSVTKGVAEDRPEQSRPVA